MSSDNNGGLSDPGSSSYSSSTLTVGDGTWDSDRNTFLLPNLMGLNFNTMQYNGMGNRFRELPQYHSLIRGHGAVAAITFLGVVPAAILIAKFGQANPGLSLKLHVYLQILTVLLTTVVFILGWFAVGPERSLTNPHHGIGLAIYVLVLAQFLFGWLMFKLERRKKAAPTMLPKKVYLHRVLGRSVALLGFVQIALGLTLYGSPQVLFILYALAGFFLLCLYLTLDFRKKYRRYRRAPGDGSAVNGSEFASDYGSYLSGSRTDFTQTTRRRHGDGEEDKSGWGWGKKLLAAGGALGAWRLWKRRNERHDDERTDAGDTYMDYDSRYDGPSRGPPGTSTMYGPSTRAPPGASTMTPSRVRSRSRGRYTESRLSPQSWEDEKYSSDTPQKHTWRNRLLGAGAGLAAYKGFKGIFGKKDREDDYERRDRYRPALGGNHSMVSQSDVTRVRNGDAPFSPGDPRRDRGPMAASTIPPTASGFTPMRNSRRGRPSTEMYSYGDGTDYDDRRTDLDDEPPTLRNSIATFGAFAGFREWNRARKQRAEDQRIDAQRMREIDNAERFNRRHSNRYPQASDGRRPSMSETIMTGMTPDPARGSNPELSRTALSQRPDISMPPLPANAGSVAPSASRTNLDDQGYTLPPPPPGPPPHSTYPGAPPVPGSAHMPAAAVTPDPSRLYDPPPSEGPPHSSAHPAGTLGANAAAASLAASSHHRTQSQSPSRYRPRASRRNSQSSASQISDLPASGSDPVRVKMHMHNDDAGRVTLSRLPDEHSQRPPSSAATGATAKPRRHRRASSLSSTSTTPARRDRAHRSRVRPSSSQPYSNVPPPPTALSNSALGSARPPPSEMNLPLPPKIPIHGGDFSGGSGMSGPVGSPGAAGTDAGTGTDVSAFADNRRRRRAERARRQAQGQRVEFE
ncbi:hypothetical protein WHR41_08163 [Cladosporium halotolerans]|uniref:Cytochrome b561 domain-containing protein n=1 Tax=Cladosporium halotolerans TaxID=1052096 RepID=A0AB34KGP2_9PEZI